MGWVRISRCRSEELIQPDVHLSTELAQNKCKEGEGLVLQGVTNCGLLGDSVTTLILGNRIEALKEALRKIGKEMWGSWEIAIDSKKLIQNSRFRSDPTKHGVKGEVIVANQLILSAVASAVMGKTIVCRGTSAGLDPELGILSSESDRVLSL